MPRYFGPDGKEIPAPKPRGELTYLATLGGDVDASSLSLTVLSPELDRDEISSLLETEPTRAWNAGELRPMPGTARTGIMRSDDFGLWQIRTERDSRPVELKVTELLSECTARLEAWHYIAERFEVSLAVVAHASNWNREVHLSKDVLSLLVERHLPLWIDVYFEPDGDE